MAKGTQLRIAEATQSKIEWRGGWVSVDISSDHNTSKWPKARGQCWNYQIIPSALFAPVNSFLTRG